MSLFVTKDHHRRLCRGARRGRACGLSVLENFGLQVPDREERESYGDKTRENKLGTGLGF